MKKIDLYNSLGMENLFWGDSFQILKGDFMDLKSIYNFLDKICLAEQKNALGDSWYVLTKEECSHLLEKALNYDLAYTSGENMSTEQAKTFRNEIFSRISSTECFYFTNWSQNPWDTINGAGWEPITENTFDMAIVIVDKLKIIFTYFISED